MWVSLNTTHSLVEDNRIKDKTLCLKHSEHFWVKTKGNFKIKVGSDSQSMEIIYGNYLGKSGRKIRGKSKVQRKSCSQNGIKTWCFATKCSLRNAL